jgi:hypothetical protein
MFLKIKCLWKLLFSDKFMLVTGDDKLNFITNYSEKEIAKSGNAIYIQPKPKPPALKP